VRVDVAVTKPFWNRTRQPVGCSGSVAKCQNRPQCYSAGSSIATRPRTASDPGCFPYCLSLLLPSGIWRAPMADCRGRGGRRCEASGRQGGPMGSLGFVSQPNTHTNFPAYFFTATLNRHGERGHARGRPHDLAHHDGLRYGRRHRRAARLGHQRISTSSSAMDAAAPRMRWRIVALLSAFLFVGVAVLAYPKLSSPPVAPPPPPAPTAFTSAWLTVDNRQNTFRSGAGSIILASGNMPPTKIETVAEQRVRNLRTRWSICLLFLVWASRMTVGEIASEYRRHIAWHLVSP